MNKTPSITVLMPIHNGASFLKEAMESILQQTLGDFEYLIVDDASTDHSVEIIRSLKDPRIRLIQSPERLKLSGALNIGLDHARGNYVARMDADDISHPRRLEIQARFLQQNPEIGLCGTWIRYFGGTSHAVLKKPLTHEAIRAFTLLDTPFAHPTVMMRRDLIDHHHLRFDGRYFPTEDFELWTRALGLFKAANLPEILLNYRIHGQSLTGLDWSAMDEQAILIIRTQLLALGLSPTAEELRFHRQLAMGRLEMTPSRLDQAESWLTTILAANQLEQPLSHEALADLLSDLWFRTCLHTARHGFWVARRYTSSPLSLHVTMPGRRQWLIRLAALKNKLRL